MKEIKINFVDFWKGFCKEELVIYDILKEKYKVKIDSKNPDYIFYSCFGAKHLEYDNAIKIFYTGENMRPDFNVCDYAIGFDYMDYGDRYIRYPIYLMIKKYLTRLESCINTKRVPNFDRKFCNMVVSNNKGAVRNDFFKELSKYKVVDSGGKTFNNIGGCVEDKIAFAANYKFTIAFENSSSPGYCTEKIIDAFLSNTIPIYYGDNTISRIFNSKTFIYLKNEKDFEKTIELIKKIDNDKKKYLSYFENNILINNEYLDEEYDRLKKFLYNIFDKDIKDARRCFKDDYSYIRYCHLKELSKIYNFIICKIMRKIRLVLKKNMERKKYS